MTKPKTDPKWLILLIYLFIGTFWSNMIGWRVGIVPLIIVGAGFIVVFATVLWWLIRREGSPRALFHALVDWTPPPPP